MVIPREITEKMELVNKLMFEIDKWMFENIDTDGSKHSHVDILTGNFEHHDLYQFSIEAHGEEQTDDGEYCNQKQIGDSGDFFVGEYYYPTEKGNYFWFDYSI